MLNVSKTLYSNLKEETTNLSRKVIRIFKKEVALDSKEISRSRSGRELQVWKRVCIKILNPKEHCGFGERWKILEVHFVGASHNYP